MMKNKLRIFFLWSLAIFILASCLWFQSSQGFDQQAVAELEEYLIDFSKKIEGHRLSTGPLPSDLNAKKFISILEQYYPDKEIIRKVSKPCCCIKCCVRNHKAFANSGVDLNSMSFAGLH